MSDRATTPLLKDMNERTVLDAIRAGAPISRAEISRRVGISKPTVSLALQSLLETGLVRETEHGGDGPSYGATFFEPVAEAAFVLGLDLGARFVRGALADLQGEIRARQDVELREPTAAAALDDIAGLVAALAENAGVTLDVVDRVVLGVPGAVDGSEIRLAMNVAGLEGKAFADALDERLELPLTIENDINLAALGAQTRGVAQGVDDFVFISIGTGLAQGILRGELHRGHNGGFGSSTTSAPGCRRTRPWRARSPRMRAHPLAGAHDAGRQHQSRATSPSRARATMSRARWSPRRRGSSRSTSPRSRRSRTYGSSCSAAASARTATCSLAACVRCSPSGSRTRHASRAQASATPPC
jgi:DNA-binding transcriptional ArsR family regulator